MKQSAGLAYYYSVAVCTLLIVPYENQDKLALEAGAVMLSAPASSYSWRWDLMRCLVAPYIS